jgi:hypothetical protein
MTSNPYFSVCTIAKTKISINYNHNLQYMIIFSLQIRTGGSGAGGGQIDKGIVSTQKFRADMNQGSKIQSLLQIQK